MEPVLLHIKAKENQYIRFILISNEDQYFQEGYLDWENWRKADLLWRKQLESLNGCIARGHKPDEIFLDMQKSLYKILKQAGIRLPGSSKYRVLSVYWSFFAAFIPFESLLPEFLPIHFLPGKGNAYSLKKDWKIMYSEKSPSAREEAYHLSKLILQKEPSAAMEYFPDSAYPQYERDFSKASFLHFAGIGKMEESRGFIQANSVWMDDISGLENPGLFYLNCCSVGAFPEGIVRNAIAEGAGAVIASPYEITDGRNRISGSALEHFYPEWSGNAQEAYVKTVLKFPDFARYFRIYLPYFAKAADIPAV